MTSSDQRTNAIGHDSSVIIRLTPLNGITRHEQPWEVNYWWPCIYTITCNLWLNAIDTQQEHFQYVARSDKILGHGRTSWHWTILYCVIWSYNIDVVQYSADEVTTIYNTCACASKGTRCSLRSDIFPVFCQFLYMWRDKMYTGAGFRHWDSIHVTTTVRLTLF